MSDDYDPIAHGALCGVCPLKTKTVVPPNGPKSAKLAIVGEAPGWNEEQQGRGFVGASGKLLDKALEANGVVRDRLWITNAALCKPPELRVGGDGQMDQKALKAAMVCCRPRLINEMRDLKKLKVIVPLGATAIRSLTNRKNLSILKARGFIWGPHRETVKKRPAPSIRKSVKIVPSVHPAFILRAPSWRVVLFSDIDRAWRAVNNKLDVPKPEIVLAPPFSKIEGLLSRLGPTVALDVETTKDRPTTANLFCVGVSDGDLSIVLPWASTKKPKRLWYNSHQGSVMVKLKRALASRTIVTQNGPGFDHIVMNRYGIDLAKYAWEDTLLAHHTYAGHLPQRLDHIVSMYLDVPPWKIVAKRGASIDEKGAWDPLKLEDDELWYYNALDGAYTLPTWMAQQDDLRPEASTYELDKELSQLCRRMQERGFAVDRGKREDLRRLYSGREKRMLTKIRKIARFRELDPFKLAHIRTALFHRLKAPVLFRSVQSGVPSTGADTLQAFAVMDNRVGEFCRTLLRWREAWKLRATYVDGISPERDGRVHPSWRSWGTVSGRFSCRDPNLQNLKRGDNIRSMYVAPRGRVLVGWDASQLEMRMAAYLSADPEFIKSCESEDIHASNAEILFGTLPSRHKEGCLLGPCKYCNPEFKSLRDVAKQAGFAVSYMAQADTVHARLLQQGFRLELIQVQKMLERMRKRYSKYYEWQEKNLHSVQRNGYLRTWGGRKRWFGREPMPTETANLPIQGGAADFINRVALEIESVLPIGAFIIAQVHDSVIIECSPGAAERVSRLCKRIAEAPVDLGNGVRASFPIEVKIGRHWSEV